MTTNDPGAGPRYKEATHPTPVLGMWVLLDFPAPKGCSNVTTLRCAVENTCVAYRTESSEGLLINF